jgi:hypothetical protein
METRLITWKLWAGKWAPAQSGTWLGSNSSLPILSITEGCRRPWSSPCVVLRSTWLELVCCLPLCMWQVEVISLSSKITSEVEGKILNRQREAFLRQQVRRQARTDFPLILRGFTLEGRRVGVSYVQFQGLLSLNGTCPVRLWLCR